jgi:hypothetical protein
MKELGFFCPGQACFIYKHVLMGLWSSKAQSIFLGFYSANSTEESAYQGKRCVQKKETRAGNKKISIKKHKFTSSSTRGLAS